MVDPQSVRQKAKNIKRRTKLLGRCPKTCGSSEVWMILTQHSFSHLLDPFCMPKINQSYCFYGSEKRVYPQNSVLYHVFFPINMATIWWKSPVNNKSHFKLMKFQCVLSCLMVKS